MKVNMNTVLKSMDESEDMTTQDGKPATLRRLVHQALGGTTKGDDTMSDDERYKLFRLGKRCNADEVTLSSWDKQTILTRVGKVFVSSAIYGQVRDLIEPPEDEAGAAVKPNGVDTHVN